MDQILLAVTTSPPDLAALRADCAAQMARFRQEHVNDPIPCLALFRLAILHKDPAAWEALLAVYRPYIQQWIRKQGVITDADLLDELVQEATVRFWRAYTPPQFARARSLADILRYWQDCAACAYLDWLRRSRNTPDALDETDQGPLNSMTLAPDGMQQDLIRSEARERLWHLVADRCEDEADRVVAHGIFVEGRKPREVFRENPRHFQSVDQVYRRLRNLKDRLRRDPELLALLEAYC